MQNQHPHSSAIPIPPGREPDALSLTLPDGYVTRVVRHRPPSDLPARKPILYVHGIESHPGWFFGSAIALANAGHCVYQVTRRGSGDNTRQPGHARSARQLLDDTQAACQFVLDHSQCDTLHLLGVSWGGKLLAAFCAQKCPLPAIASLTLVTPGLIPAIRIPASLKLRVVSRLGLPQRGSLLVKIPLGDPALFTNNPAMQDYLRNDPLRLHHASARFLLANEMLNRQLRRAREDSIPTPTTLILAHDDKIIHNQRTRDRLVHLTSQPLRIVELPGAHTFDFEPDPTPYFQALRNAIERAETPT